MEPRAATKQAIARAKHRRRNLALLARTLPGGWGRVLVTMGHDFTVHEWVARLAIYGIEEDLIRFILDLRAEDLRDGT